MLLLTTSLAFAQDLHALRVVDDQGEPVRCVTLETVHHVPLQTDDDGWIAVYEPGLMGGQVWLRVLDDAARAPADGFGIEGVQVQLTEGGTTEITLERLAPTPACGRGDIEQRRIVHGVPTAAEHHALQVVDADTGRPVPAVRLTVAGVEHWTDNGGRVAFFDLGHMGTTETVQLWSHGYAPTQADVDLVAGSTSLLEITRTQVAERLVRLTGGGTWRDTALLGLDVPVTEPFLDSQVLGQDTAHVVPWRDGLFWLWGDTNRPSYILGNFHATGATSALDDRPDDGVDLDYIEADDGFVAPIAPMFAEGPVWLAGLAALSDDELWATYVNVGPTFEALNAGVLRWDDSEERFVEAVRFDENQQALPEGPALNTSGPDGDHVVYRSLHRVAADPEALGDAQAYESYTPLQPDGTIERDDAGVAVWRWRTDAPAPRRGDVDAGTFPRAFSPWHQALDPVTGHTPVLHEGAIAYSPHHDRWLHVYTESFGLTSLIGEIWIAEGDTPVGPWTWTTQLMTHDDYSFYNPIWHPWFASEQGTRLLFEGTYTAWLGGQPATPRHDYNQQLMAVDLTHPELVLPVAFYEGNNGPVTAKDARSDGLGDRPQRFGAYDRERLGTVALRWTAPDCDPVRTLSTTGEGEVAMWVEPPGTKGPGRVDLASWRMSQGRTGYGPTPPEEGAEQLGVLGTVHAPLWTPDVPLGQFVPVDAADAGPDQCGVTSPVPLDASSSRLAGGIDAYTWRWEGGTAAGPAPEIELSNGLHTIVLEIVGTDTHGAEVMATDVMVVNVVSATTTHGTDGGTDTGTPDPSTGCSCGNGAPLPLALGPLLAALLTRRRSRR
ncbi:MAG: hypothetical protein KTR31_03045 [Myxococcales bacterium]|nr:hypothetical protein [Myxococcales bacterium]